MFRYFESVLSGIVYSAEHIHKDVFFGPNATREIQLMAVLKEYSKF
jgi:hypothetical protein